jgi:hypothetical protein
MVILRRMRDDMGGRVMRHAKMGRNALNFFVGNPEGKRPLGKCMY